MLEGNRFERLREHMSNDGIEQLDFFIVSIVNFLDVLLSLETNRLKLVKLSCFNYVSKCLTSSHKNIK